jgi:hypothetical protein
MSLLRVAVISLYSSAALAQIPGLQPEKALSLDGYINQMIIVNSLDGGASSSDYLLHNRLDLQYRATDELELNLSMRNRLVLSDRPISSFSVAQFDKDTGHIDMSTNWHEQSRSIGNSQLDRLFLQWQKEDWQVRGGRFRINWGMNTVWNPNDLFNSYSLFDVDYPEKPGADALAIKRALGFASELEFAAALGTDEQGNSVAGKYRFNSRGWDGQLIAGVTNDNRFIGIGSAGSLRDAALRAEVSYFNNREASELVQDNTLVASIEADYSFASEKNWAVKAAYLYIDEPEIVGDVSRFLSQPLTARTLSFTRNSIYGELGFELTPLSRIALSGIFYQDGSRYFSLSDTYSLSDNWQLRAIVQRYYGSNGSVFGRQPSNTFYGQIRWDF